MATDEFLLKLFEIHNKFQSLNDDSYINKDFLNTMKSLLEMNPANISLNFYKNLNNNKNCISDSVILIEKIIKLYDSKNEIIASFDPDKLVGRESKFFESSIRQQKRRLDEASDVKKEWTSQIESGVYKFEEDSIELKIIESNLEIADKEYKYESEKYRDLLNQQNKSLEGDFWIYDVTFEKFHKRLSEIKSSLINLSELYEKPEVVKSQEKQNVFIDDIYISKAYEVFLKAELIQSIDIVEFRNQISCLSEFKLMKQPKTDKYIAYAIFKLKDFIKANMRNSWEVEMVKNFEIKDYPKKKNVTDDVYKKDKHLLIDNILEKISYEN